MTMRVLMQDSAYLGDFVRFVTHSYEFRQYLVWLQNFPVWTFTSSFLLAWICQNF